MKDLTKMEDANSILEKYMLRKDITALIELQLEFGNLSEEVMQYVRLTPKKDKDLFAGVIWLSLSYEERLYLKKINGQSK